MRNVLLSCLLLLSIAVKSQDLHLSQYYMSPLTLNPAMTGVFNDNIRITGNYRNQWQSILPGVPFNSYQTSVDFSAKSGANNRIGVGIGLLSDDAGSLDISKTEIDASLAYLLALSKSKGYYISAGVQASYSYTSFDFAKIISGSQWTGTTFNSSFYGGSSFLGDHKAYVDGAAGLLFYHFKNPDSYQFIGLSGFHLNQPNISFVQSSVDPLYTKYSLQMGAGFKLLSRLGLMPYLLGLVQGPDYEADAGTFFKLLPAQKTDGSCSGTSFYLGPFFRIVGNNYHAIGYDALIIASKIEVGQLTVGLSYDINISSLQVASSGRGGPEFSLQYIGAFTKKPFDAFCPKF